MTSACHWLVRPKIERRGSCFLLPLVAVEDMFRPECHIFSQHLFWKKYGKMGGRQSDWFIQLARKWRGIKKEGHQTGGNYCVWNKQEKGQIFDWNGGEAVKQPSISWQSVAFRWNKLESGAGPTVRSKFVTIQCKSARIIVITAENSIHS